MDTAKATIAVVEHGCVHFRGKKKALTCVSAFFDCAIFA